MHFSRKLAASAVGAVIAVVLGCTGSDGPILATQEAVLAGGSPTPSALTPIEVVQAECGGAHKNHGECVSCVAHAVDAMRQAGTISASQANAILMTFAQGNCQDGCIPTSCAAAGVAQGTIPDLCGGTLSCSCPAGDALVSGKCVPGCNPLSVTNGNDRITCLCKGGQLEQVALCGSCDGAQSACDTACSNCNSFGAQVVACQGGDAACPIPATTTCALYPKLTVPPPGQDLLECQCQSDGIVARRCDSCDNPTACEDQCATCGGGYFTQCLQTGSPACTPLP